MLCLGHRVTGKKGQQIYKTNRLGWSRAPSHPRATSQKHELHEIIIKIISLV